MENGVTRCCYAGVRRAAISFVTFSLSRTMTMTKNREPRWQCRDKLQEMTINMTRLCRDGTSFRRLFVFSSLNFPLPRDADGNAKKKKTFHGESSAFYRNRSNFCGKLLMACLIWLTGAWKAIYENWTKIVRKFRRRARKTKRVKF